MSSVILWSVWFGVAYFAIAFIRLYYYVYVKKENKVMVMQEIKKDGPFFSTSNRRRNR